MVSVSQSPAPSPTVFSGSLEPKQSKRLCDTAARDSVGGAACVSDLPLLSPHCSARKTASAAPVGPEEPHRSVPCLFIPPRLTRVRRALLVADIYVVLTK